STERAVTLFPEPLSPTNATVSPRSRVKETPFTAATGGAPPRPAKVTLRSRISRRGAPTNANPHPASPHPFPPPRAGEGMGGGGALMGAPFRPSPALRERVPRAARRVRVVLTGRPCAGR